MIPPFLDTGAAFSPCARYRYRLHRRWGESPRDVAFIMLNPSTATAEVLDPTVRRCVGYAHRWGYGGLVVGNIFALRSTDPRALYSTADPIGPDNDLALERIATEAALVVCAWGKHGALHGRGQAVLERLLALGVTPHALKLNGDGSPAHPLYQRGDARPLPIAA